MARSRFYSSLTDDPLFKPLFLFSNIMKIKPIVIPSLLALLTCTGLSQQTTEEIELQTKAATPASGKARVMVNPAYLADPDGSGLDAWAARDSSLVGRWDFEDAATSGPFADSSIYNNTMKLTSGQSQTDGVSKSVYLNGGKNLDATLSGNPNSTTGNMSLSFWFKITDNSLNTKIFATLFRIDEYFMTNNTMAIAAGEINNQNYLTIRHGPWTSSVFYANYTNWPLNRSSRAVAPSTLQINFATTTLDNGKWHHLVFTYNKNKGGYPDLYLNGSKLIQIGTKPSILAANGKLKNKYIRFGHVTDNLAGNPIFYLNGNIDRIRLYNREISAAEVTHLTNQNADGDAVTDRNELLNGSDPLDASQ